MWSKILLVIISVGSGLLLAVGVGAQTDMVTVPSVEGLNVPQAAAALNSSGLRLGEQRGAAWTEASPLPVNTISGQSAAVGDQIAYGTPVDVTVLTSTNLILFYDENDITLVNQLGRPLNTGGISFRSTDGARVFAAAEWGGAIGDGDCGQLWSINRRDPKRLPECSSISWRSTSDTSRHFWTALAGVTSFSVIQDGVERGTCDAAPAGSDLLRCDIFIVGGTTRAQETAYLHFAYLSGGLAVINTSTDQWMPLAATPLFDAAAGTPVSVSAPALFADPRIVADPARLAPGQCILLTTGDPTLPQPCDVVATALVAAGDAFWQRGFQVESITGVVDERVLCPPADANPLTLCVLPR
ncbi:MAG: PASTA domain-containing protein [Chloroflexi bacterium]|nr:PASTA domain-containing protein [Chloroflexota bacterium]